MKSQYLTAAIILSGCAVYPPVNTTWRPLVGHEFLERSVSYQLFHEPLLQECFYESPESLASLEEACYLLTRFNIAYQAFLVSQKKDPTPQDGIVHHLYAQTARELHTLRNRFKQAWTRGTDASVRRTSPLDLIVIEARARQTPIPASSWMDSNLESAYIGLRGQIDMYNSVRQQTGLRAVLSE